MAITNQINIRFDPERLKRLDTAVERFRKADRGQVIRELFDTFMDIYEESEEAYLKVVLKAEEARQKVLDERKAHLHRATGSKQRK